jgi:hypothetical protein
MARAKSRTPHWQPTGVFQKRVVGTSYYRSALQAMAGNLDGEAAFALFTARIALEEANEFDSNAVAVFYESEKIGHLAASETLSYRAKLELASPGCQVATVDGLVRNGQRVGGTEYAYTVRLDFSESSTLLEYFRPTLANVLRLNPYQELCEQSDGSFIAPVWLGDVDLSDLDKYLTVHTWTTPEWSKVNFYLLNRQGIGLGYKVYEMQKFSYEAMFPNERYEARLLFPSGNWGLLCLRRR